METFAMYLLKSVIWISGFALIFFLFLRDERFFVLNRFYLLAGILASFFLPLISVHYTVVLPTVENIQTGSAVVTGIQAVSKSPFPDLRVLLSMLYISGVFFVTVMLLSQNKPVLKTIKEAEIIRTHPVKLIRTSRYPSSFSFFSYVFVNPSITDVETEEIVNHELVHVRQWHWFDLVLVELLCILQWFNPVVWIYVRFIRQNHEYLADEVALQRTSNPAIYKAALLNQVVGYPVVSLANSFNYSLNSKRFKMMKNIISSPYRKLKILLILPVIAIVLYSFAKPEYKYTLGNDNPINKDPDASDQKKEVKGIVVQEDGGPLPGASIILLNTTIGTQSDGKGFFRLENVPENGSLVISFVGFRSKVLKPVFNTEMTIKMIQDTLNLENVNAIPLPPSPPPPPPPPPPPSTGSPEPSTPPEFLKIRSENGIPPLVVIDGVITEIDVNKIDPESVESITVLKNAGATNKYGEKGKNGAVEITTKKNESSGSDKIKEAAKSTGSSVNQKADKDNYVIVEELPQFPGGGEAMKTWISQNLKYPPEAMAKKIEGTVKVRFVINSKGKPVEVAVMKAGNPLLDAEAVRLISSMPDWKPGSQAGKWVSVHMKLPVEFKLQ